MTDVIQNAIDALSLGSLYALLALGVALIFGIMRLLNFAYGQLIMVGGYSLWALDGLPTALQILGMVLIVIAVALAARTDRFSALAQRRPGGPLGQLVRHRVLDGEPGLGHLRWAG